MLYFVFLMIDFFMQSNSKCYVGKTLAWLGL